MSASSSISRGRGRNRGKGKPAAGGNNRESRRTLGRETVDIANSGMCGTVEIGHLVEAARSGRVEYGPKDDVVSEWDAIRGEAAEVETVFEVTPESSMKAARRLDAAAPGQVAVLSFASAKNPGGGVLKGSKAQEEDLCRASALYKCLLGAPGYAANKANDRRGLYTDHALYVPQVPVFRYPNGRLIASSSELKVMSFVSSAAPNRGRLGKNRSGECKAALVRRIERALAMMAVHGHWHIVLSAFGCGVFKNPADEVAAVFADVLRSPRFAGVFEHVVFAVLCNSTGRPTANFRAFAAKFAAEGGASD